MADEITAVTNLSLRNGNIKTSRATSKKITQTTARHAASVQAIGTTYEAITIPSDIATPGWAVFTNTHATNYVELGIEVAAAFHAFVKLLPGESAQLRLGTTAPFAKANTTAIDLEVTVLAA